MKQVKSELKIFNERKNELENKISDFMIGNNIPEFSTSDGKESIQLYERKSKSPLNKEYLQDAISDKVDSKTVEEIVIAAFDRPTVQVQKIKISKKKKT